MRQVGRKRGYVERGDRPAAHGVYVAESVGSRYRSILHRVVHDGRKEVKREHQRDVVAYSVHRGVVGRAETDEYVVVLERRGG